MSPATIRDVARIAGVGIGTVSRVINNHPSVRESTRQRVEEAIEQLDYTPNIIARQLSLGRTMTIAVMAPFFIRPSFVERLRGVEAVLTQNKYDLVLYNVETREKRSELFQALPTADQFDGLLILTLAPSDEEAARLQRTELPVVLVDAQHPDFSRVVIDDVKGGYMATDHLIRLGHRRIAYISDRLENTPLTTGGASMKRYKGYVQALEDAGISFRPEYYRQDYHGVREAKRMTQALLSLPHPPTAIFAASDTQAIGAMQAAAERNLAVPEDLSIIGFDDIEVAEYVSLTTIHQPLFTSGVEGAELLIRHIADPEATASEPVEIMLPLQLVERKTTAPSRNVEQDDVAEVNVRML